MVHRIHPRNDVSFNKGGTSNNREMLARIARRCVAKEQDKIETKSSADARIHLHLHRNLLYEANIASTPPSFTCPSYLEFLATRSTRSGIASNVHFHLSEQAKREEYDGYQCTTVLITAFALSCILDDRAANHRS